MDKFTELFYTLDKLTDRIWAVSW